MAQSSTLETLARLSAKPGVQSTLVLSRTDGAIIQSSGFSVKETSSSTGKGNGSGDFRASNTQEGATNSSENLGSTSEQQRASKPEEIAHAVFNYVSEAGKLIEAVGGNEDVQLLRLRTKKQEIVIVPDQRYLMVVIQEPPKTA